MSLEITYFDKVKYKALDFINRFSDFFGNGILKTTDFPITYPSTPDMTLNVGVGTAWINGYRIYSDAITTLVFSAGDTNYQRIDIVQIGYTSSTDSNGMTTGQAVLQVKQGVAASSPIEPGSDPNFVKLYAVSIPAKSSSITSANVTDRRSLVPLNVNGSQIAFDGAQKSIYQQSSAPLSPADKDLWIDTSVTPNVWKRYNAATTSWVKATPTTAAEVGAATTALGTTSSAGLLQLVDSITSTDKTKAATANSVKMITDKVQMMKITADDGGQTINAAQGTDVLSLISAKGTGLNTIYCAYNALNSPNSNNSSRGISYLNNPTYGFILLVDEVGNVYTNYLKGGNWSGWALSASQDWSKTNLQSQLITTKDGQDIIHINDTSIDFLSTVVSYGPGLRTFYCVGGAVNTPSSHSIRGYAFIQGSGPYFGNIICVDTIGNVWTNFYDGSVPSWGGWKQLAFATVESWNAPSFINSWMNYGSPYLAAGYRKDSANKVTLRGMINGGTSGTAVFMLPAGYRPSGTIVFPVIDTNDGTSTARVSVNSSGYVTVNWYAGSYVSLDGISFYAD